MATYVSQYSTTGFYRAPVSKGLMGALFVTCTAIHVPLLSHLRVYLICHLPNTFTSGEVWRLFTSQAAFLETKDLICAALLIYYFRVFERRLGSKKFASHLFATSLISLALQVPLILLIRSTGWSSYHHGHLPPGPYGLIFPLFVPYLCDIPRMTRTHILGIPITGKTLTYLVGLQVCSTSFPTAVAAFCSIAAGLLYRWNVLKIQDWLVIPDWLARLTNLTLGRLLSSSPPADGPMGATLEIQRQEQMERLEHQMLLQRSRDGPPRQNTGQGYAERLVGPEMQWGEQGANGHPRRRRANDFPNLFNPNEARPNNRVPPSEENVTFLTSMGFSRDRVMRALQTTGNNVEAAANLLVNDV